ncbi:MAG: hypothetical protein LBG98_01875 [Puniceicoccales bacterium]|jgi:hypothetical protein|nr:hypothetical protein [Puniceicoccales bacterium]
MKIKLLFLLTIFLSGCATTGTKTELSMVRKRLNDPNLLESEREDLLTRQDFLSFVKEGFLIGDALYMADLMRQLRDDPDNPELEEKFLLAQRDAFNRRKEDKDRARRDIILFFS